MCRIDGQRRRRRPARSVRPTRTCSTRRDRRARRRSSARPARRPTGRRRPLAARLAGWACTGWPATTSSTSADGARPCRSIESIHLSPPPDRPDCRHARVAFALALVFGERLAKFLNGDLFLLRRQDDLARQHHAHRAGRVGEERVERHRRNGSARLRPRSTDPDRSARGSSRRATEIEWQTKQPVCTNQPPGPVFIACFGLQLLGASRIGARRARHVARRHVVAAATTASASRAPAPVRC